MVVHAASILRTHLPIDRCHVAVAPEGLRPFLKDAVVAGGGVVVEPARAAGLVWTAPSQADALRTILDDNAHIGWVQLPWAGIEPYLDVLDAVRVWTAGQGVYAIPVAEHALALMLAGLHNLPSYARTIGWSAPVGQALAGARITIFGAGAIARALVKLLVPFDVDITIVRNRAVPLAGLRTVALSECVEAVNSADVVVLALALTPRTRHCIGARELDAMRPGTLIVNVARGGHLDTDALVAALSRGHVRAALDVTDPEPLPPEHALWRLPGCMITPHVSNTPEMAVPLLSERVRENVARFIAGQPLLGVVDVEQGY